MKTISVVNLKGGVGKTTTVVNMAALLAREWNKHVLVVDCDPQANATQFFENEPGVGAAEIILGEYDLADGLIFATPVKNVDLIRASMALAEADIAALRGGDASAERLRETLEDIGRMDFGYDYIILDCPPCFSAASCAAIMASEDIIIPVKPDGFALSGTRELAQQIANLQELNPGIVSVKALVTMWHNSEAVLAGEAALRGFAGLDVFQTTIRRTDKVDESTYARQTLDTWSPYSSAGRDYRAFVYEYLTGGEA